MKFRVARDPFHPLVERWSPSRRRYVWVTSWAVFKGDECRAWQLPRAQAFKAMRDMAAMAVPARSDRPSIRSAKKD